ncbi:MAG: hypothetical protein M1832_002823 [Thelocarpon impressellum]|nr:MAG: hypothetical protein M1832_002823 [Thelocarpon impressellum]
MADGVLMAPAPEGGEGDRYRPDPSHEQHPPRQQQAASAPGDSRRHSLPLDFLIPSLWSGNTSVASLAESSEQAARGETTATTRDGGGNGGTTALRAAALRRLNGPPSSSSASRHRHRQSKSVGAPKSSFSQPVIVRSYSKAARLDSRRAGGGGGGGAVPAIQEEEQQSLMATTAELPPLEAFSFDGILKAIEPEISATLDAIASICANSRYSLSNQYEVHMPPHLASELDAVVDDREDRPDTGDAESKTGHDIVISIDGTPAATEVASEGTTAGAGVSVVSDQHPKLSTTLFSGFADTPPSTAGRRASSPAAHIRPTSVATTPAPQVLSSMQLAVSSGGIPQARNGAPRPATVAEHRQNLAAHGRRASVLGRLSSWLPWAEGADVQHGQATRAPAGRASEETAESAADSLRGLLSSRERV